MQIALIPPISWLSTTEITHYQLMLPHLLKSRKYNEHYERLCSDKQQYVIMDNGEAEGENTQSDAQLIGRALYMKANTVVIPDVMGESVKTLNRLEEFFASISNLDNGAFTSKDVFRKLRFMAVVQARTLPEALNTADLTMEIAGEKIHTLALPRLLSEATQNSGARLHLAEYISRNYPDVQIHCLGAAPSFPQEMKALAEQGIVTGMDTSMPFYYAYYGFKMDQPEPIARPYGYFHKKAKDFNTDILHYNIGLCRRWVGAIPSTSRLDD